MRKALPDATLVVGRDTLMGLLGLIEDTKPPMAREMAFLAHVAPWLASPVAGRRVDAIWDDILAGPRKTAGLRSPA